ncbi:MAG: AAA family ATPase [Clostridiales Family XIII bacterium]|jgi:CO dehydrogenase maturation factor|nr:AAA family ATPase [Clostridiales Family XIII bacterium]
MAEIIAVTGKGGTGKTTLSGFLIEGLARKGFAPILAVDADANANLADVLGVEAETTLAALRDTINGADMDEDSPIPPGISKQEWLDSKFATAITEEDDYDLLVMGRTQGKGCYCFVNGLLQSHLAKYAGNYRYLVVDNEAGMEHLSRGVLPKVDRILIVSDCSRRGVQAAGRIQELSHELNLKPKSIDFIVNKAPNDTNKTPNSQGEIPQGIADEIKAQGLHLVGVVPEDPLVAAYDADGRPTATLPQDAPSRAAFEEIMEKILASGNTG